MSLPCLYLISDGGYLRKRGQLIRTIEQALSGGRGRIGYVQLREQNKDAAEHAGTLPASDRELRELITALLPVCSNYRAKLILSRRVDLAKEMGCDGVHLGEIGTSVLEARQALGPQATIGYSAHSVEKIRELANLPISYALLSPIFMPFSKIVDVRPLGLEPLTEASSLLSVPVFALGGISTETAASCLRAGAQGVATISAVLFAPDAARKASEFAGILEKSSSPH